MAEKQNVDRYGNRPQLTYHHSGLLPEESIMADDAIEYMLANVSIDGAERVIQ